MSVLGNIHAQQFPRRGERRFLVDEEMASLILDILNRHSDLAVEDQSTPWRTTVYCDTPDRRIFRSAESGAGLLMRFREYHLTRPESVFTNAETWLEFKPGEQFTGKTRWGLPSQSVPALLRGEVELGLELGDIDIDGYLHRLLYAGVRPVFATQYHRVAYVAQGEIIRITADREVSYRTLPHWQATAGETVPCPLGPAFFREFGVVIEIKWLQALPDWAVTVAEFLRPYIMNDDERKFVVGMRHLHRTTAGSRPVSPAVGTNCAGATRAEG